jgi:hypothetical protein
MIARMLKTNRILAIIVVIVALIAITFTALYFGPDARKARGDDAARALMSDFGSKLKNVPLLGDDAVVTKAIEDNYGAYITPELLADWKANHAHAPGRLTSSPWPERLTIATMSEQGSGRVISGEVILKTSTEGEGEVADTVPYVAQVIQTAGGWKIAAYQEEKVQTLKNIPKTDEDIPGAR